MRSRLDPERDGRRSVRTADDAMDDSDLKRPDLSTPVGSRSTALANLPERYPFDLIATVELWINGHNPFSPPPRSPQSDGDELRGGGLTGEPRTDAPAPKHRLISPTPCAKRDGRG